MPTEKNPTAYRSIANAKHRRSDADSKAEANYCGVSRALDVSIRPFCLMPTSRKNIPNETMEATRRSSRNAKPDVWAARVVATAYMSAPIAPMLALKAVNDAFLKPQFRRCSADCADVLNDVRYTSTRKMTSETTAKLGMAGASTYDAYLSG